MSKSANSAAAIPACALDQEGIESQRARYTRLSSDVERLERTPDAVLVAFRKGFHRRTLDEALAVERACCPFFLFDFDEARRRLHVTVREPEQLPALDAIAHALGAAQ